MKKLLTALLLAALLCASALAEAPASRLGKPLEDFSVETIDGSMFTLSEVLEDHDMVLINLWATWCPPCEREFPYLEEAYEQYSDRVAVVALSIEPTDSPEALRDYADAHGLTFPVGSGLQTNLADAFSVTSIPTSIVVDRFGSVALVEAGAQTSTMRFTMLFDYFLSEDYTETTVLDGFPTPRPVAAADEAQLAAGGALDFVNPEGDGLWPMLPTEDGGRAALQSSNAGVGDSTAVVYAEVNARAGDALAFDFRTSLQPAFDALFISVDNETVKRFTGEHDWTSWAISLPEGVHEVAFGVEKDHSGDGVEDRAWISNARVVAQGEVELPAPPVSDRFSARLDNPEARAVTIDDPDGIVAYYFGASEGWIVDGEARLEVTLSAAEDPETAFVYNSAGNTTLSGAEEPDGSGYAVSLPFDGDGYDVVQVYPGTSEEQLARGEVFLLFDGEAGADAFVAYLAENDVEVAWHYGEASAPAEALTAYTVHVVDQNGDAVPGAVVNFCTDTTCTTTVSDDGGVITFDGAPDAYHLQILKVPEGYSFDRDFDAYTEAEYGEMTIEVAKD